ncbi:DUF5067 domain-containing protein [Listeria monocytogenes]|nr:DUF5067 domain-containing protein [Listeria monocytogenes]EAF5966827.1 DUF5067 domain-containing protein [Listeria monocytogenes]MCV43444.1 DUF5067 domain-containing protein [Listeria monocytogenes]
MEDEKYKALTIKNMPGSAGFIIALTGLIYAIIEMFTRWIPLLGWIVLILGLILSIIGIFKNPKDIAISGTTISVIAISLLIVNGASFNSKSPIKPPIDSNNMLASYANRMDIETLRTLYTPETILEHKKKKLKEAPTLENGVIENEQIKIQITSHKIIPIGAKGNESGDKSIIAFWFEVTNKSGGFTSPISSWVEHIAVYQDTRSDLLNTLKSTTLDDAQFLDSASRLSEDIKKGATVKCAIAYGLDDDEIPVDLAYRDFLSEVVYGKINYQIK